MKRILIAAWITLLVPAVRTSAGPDEGTISEARRLMDQGQHAAAAEKLMPALRKFKGGDRDEALKLLRTCFQRLAEHAEASGDRLAAATYRDDLSILETTSRSLPPPAPATGQPKPAAPQSSPKPKPAERELTPIPFISQDQLQPTKPATAARSMRDESSFVGNDLAAPKATPQPSPTTGDSRAQSSSANLFSTLAPPAQLAPPPDLGPPASVPPPLEEPRLKRPAAQPAQIEPPARSVSPRLAEADKLYKAKRYLEAGEIYSALARQDQLPDSRRKHWAYCRWCRIVAQINAHPRTAREWDAIEAELDAIDRDCPGKVWIGEYLRDKVAELRRGKRAVVVRGADPDEPKPGPLKRLFGGGDNRPNPRPDPDNPRPDPVSPALVLNQPASTDPGDSQGPTHAPVGQWSIRESQNFRVFHHDDRLAEAVLDHAEKVRTRQFQIWSSGLAANWNPRCDIYLHQDGASLAQHTGQPADSPGFSTMASDGSRVVDRKVNLRGDHPHLLTAILPHEVTHVVLADLFTDQQIPRWADEGMAVLAEPAAEREARALDLKDPLQSGRIFRLDVLMKMDYPNPRDWNLYYAQSVSLTRFLVELGQPRQLIQFARRAQRDGIEPALREIYQIDGLADLEARWRAAAWEQLGLRTADAGSAEGVTVQR